MDQLVTGAGTLELRTEPHRPNRPLRAWDAADEYVIAETPPALAMAVVGDRHGALTCAFAEVDPVPIIESHASRSALHINRAHNGLSGAEPISVLEASDVVAAESLELAIVRIPKSTNELTDVLHRLRPLLRPDAIVVGASMVKHLPDSASTVFASIIGPTSLSRARKKARLLTAHVDPALVVGAHEWPRHWKSHGCTLVNHGGGFSPERLDAGTDVFLTHLHEILGDEGGVDRIVDLGCGNGVVGLVAAKGHQGAGIVAIDDSALAVAATEDSWQATMPEQLARLETHHAHRMIGVVDAASVDAVLINPPFHDDRVVGDDTAWSMFVDAHKVLRPGGVIGVVGNRHLAYHAKLKKIFGNVETVAANKRFVVLRATKSDGGTASPGRSAG